MDHGWSLKKFSKFYETIKYIFYTFRRTCKTLHVVKQSKRMTLVAVNWSCFQSDLCKQNVYGAKKATRLPIYIYIYIAGQLRPTSVWPPMT